ncbi:hypothetical protein BDW74DRAFT_98120 [Aspergillus multicolor]|uniref:uncharacterized protein n=1 Tax=Aspergillus multicolor TaxID=41759 RepID=UPI003CCCB13B
MSCPLFFLSFSRIYLLSLLLLSILNYPFAHVLSLTYTTAALYAQSYCHFGLDQSIFFWVQLRRRAALSGTRSKFNFGNSARSFSCAYT